MRWLVPVATIALLSSSALASSHREAPFITKNPKVDGTDFYLFNSYEPGRANFVTAIANYQPLQDAYGGPNYFSMDPEALYEIHFDNTGDAVEDITLQFRFQNTLQGNRGVTLPIALPDGGALQTVAIPLINAFPIGLADGGFTPTALGDGGVSRAGPGQGQLETFTVGLIRGARRSNAVQPVTHSQGAVFEKPLDNVGAKTFPGGSYAAYAATFVYTATIPGCGVPAKIFVGQRKEGFAVNLGTIFDLVNAPAAVITDPGLRGAVPNGIATKNVSTIAVEIDKSCLTSAAGGTVVGGWSTASVRQARVINPQGNYQVPTREGGAWAQVSRLGMPLVNEVVIGVPDKDRFNSSEPKDDLSNFAPYVTNPTLPALIEILFSAPAPRFFPRTDLIAAFLTGVTGVNAFNGTNATPAVAEMVRLNTALPATPNGSQNNLGALECFQNRTATMGPVVVLPPSLGGTNAACDPAGFPNGRRPGDDVVDVALRVSMGALLSTDAAPAAAVPFHDAVLQDDSDFDGTFPYLKTPNSGT
ncbi:MAG: DUF4331 domain-containing protein [Archangium sp.]|nr:DUF4331 domain-containing protein [Archangium sp.]